MFRRQPTSDPACPRRRGEVELILSLAEDDPIRQTWATHAKGCPDCGRLLSEDLTAIRRLQELPEAGEPLVVGRVMEAIRTSGESLRFGVREIAWGAVGSVAGVVLGFWISGYQPTRTVITSGAYYTVALSEMGHSLDDVMQTLFEAYQEVQQ